MYRAANTVVFNQQSSAMQSGPSDPLVVSDGLVLQD